MHLRAPVHRRWQAGGGCLLLHLAQTPPMLAFATLDTYARSNLTWPPLHFSPSLLQRALGQDGQLVVLGEGACAAVYLGKLDGSHVAVKASSWLLLLSPLQLTMAELVGRATL
jgi:hypothetical protein